MEQTNKSFNRGLLLTAAILAFIIAIAGAAYLLNKQPDRVTKPDADSKPTIQFEEAEREGLVGYFQQRINDLGISEVGRPIEGFDAQMLMVAFPGLSASDFNNVETLGGRYQAINGSLEFERDSSKPATSAEMTVSNSGYETLLVNLSSRLQIQVSTEADIDMVIEKINTSETIELGLNEEANVFGLKIKPTGVLEDTRCWPTANCVEAGDIRVQVLISGGLGQSEEVFGVDVEKSTETAVITMIRVEPNRSPDQTIKPEEYSFVFRVEKRN